MSLKIGITGGIGSGKTTVAKCFALLGIPVYDADAATKALYHSNAELRQALEEKFGATIYVGDQLDRPALARQVFADPALLEWLNQTVHPLTIADAAQWMARQTSPYVIKEAALLFESGSVAGLDRVIGVYAPQHIRLKRAMDRDGASREDILNRMSRQVNEEMKMRLCDHVIRNTEQELVWPQVLALDAQFRQLAAELSPND